MTNPISFEAWLDGVVLFVLKREFAAKRRVMLDKLAHHVWQHPDRPTVEPTTPRGTHQFRFFIGSSASEQHQFLLESVYRLLWTDVSLVETPVWRDGMQQSVLMVAPTTLLDELARI